MRLSRRGRRGTHADDRGEQGERVGVAFLERVDRAPAHGRLPLGDRLDDLGPAHRRDTLLEDAHLLGRERREAGVPRRRREPLLADAALGELGLEGKDDAQEEEEVELRVAARRDVLESPEGNRGRVEDADGKRGQAELAQFADEEVRQVQVVLREVARALSAHVDEDKGRGEAVKGCSRYELK